MSDQESFFYPEINLQKLPKTALKVLQKCEKLISHHRQSESAVKAIRLFSVDYMTLSEAVEKNKQDLSKVVYKGYRILPQ